MTVVPDAVANANELVEVTLVKIPVEGVVFPIDVPFTEPPVITAFEEERFANPAFKAFTVEPEAVANPRKPVDVTLVKVPFVAANVAIFKLVPVALVKMSCVAVAAENTAVPPSKFTLFAVKFNAVKLEPEAVAKPSHWVDVTFVNEAFVNVADVPVKLAIIAEDVTFKLAVTKFPVDVPPANWINCVVTFPCVVTCCKVGVAFPAGQLVPFAKHGN